MKSKLFYFATFVFAIAFLLSARANVYPFSIFNDANYACNPNLHFEVEVFDPPGQVIFEFRNMSTISCVITEIYFDNGSLISLESIINNIISEENKIGTKFIMGATPQELPGCNLVNPVFRTTEGFSAEPSAPPAKWGINPGEWVQLVYNLDEGATFEDVIAELDSGIDLRIGIRIQSLPGEPGSCSALNTPEPATLLLLAIGSAAILRKRNS